MRAAHLAPGEARVHLVGQQIGLQRRHRAVDEHHLRRIDRCAARGEGEQECTRAIKQVDRAPRATAQLGFAARRAPAAGRGGSRRDVAAAAQRARRRVVCGRATHAWRARSGETKAVVLCLLPVGRLSVLSRQRSESQSCHLQSHSGRGSIQIWQGQIPEDLAANRAGQKSCTGSSTPSTAPRAPSTAPRAPSDSTPR